LYNVARSAYQFGQQRHHEADHEDHDWNVLLMEAVGGKLVHGYIHNNVIRRYILRERVSSTWFFLHCEPFITAERLSDGEREKQKYVL